MHSANWRKQSEKSQEIHGLENKKTVRRINQHIKKRVEKLVDNI